LESLGKEIVIVITTQLEVCNILYRTTYFRSQQSELFFQQKKKIKVFIFLFFYYVQIRWNKILNLITVFTV